MNDRRQIIARPAAASSIGRMDRPIQYLNPIDLIKVFHQGVGGGSSWMDEGDDPRLLAQITPLCLLVSSTAAAAAVVPE